MSDPETYSAALQAAMAILGQEPLPADAEQQLADLEASAPAAERDLFADIWEGFMVASGKEDR